MDAFIIIVGLSATGKTTLAQTFDTSYEVINTDDYLHYKSQSPYYLDKSAKYLDKVVMEGITSYTYLKDMYNFNFRKPDLIINCTAPREIRIERLRNRGTLSGNSFSMDNVYQKMWNKFLIYNTIKVKDVMHMGVQQN